MQKNEHEAAKAWRLRHGLSVAQLAHLTSYSVESIYWYERGLSPQGSGKKPTRIKEWVWQRYRRACQGVDAELRTKREFVW